MDRSLFCSLDGKKMIQLALSKITTTATHIAGIALGFPGIGGWKMEFAVNLFQRLTILENAGVGIDVELLFVCVVLHSAARNFVVLDATRNCAKALQRLPEKSVIIGFTFEKAVQPDHAQRRPRPYNFTLESKKAPISDSPALCAAWERLL